MNRFLQFCVVGATGMVVVDFGSFHALRALGLTDKLSLGLVKIPYANMISVALAIQWNFVGNRLTTFRDRDTPWATAWWRFNVFSSSTWLLNNLIIGAFVAAWGPDTVPLPAIGDIDIENVWKVIAIGICTVANFWLSSKLAFRESVTAEGAPGAAATPAAK